MKIQQLQFKQLTREAIKDIASFSCGNYTMERFLIENAYHHHITREASTTLVYYNNIVIGYYTLNRTALNFEFPNSLIKKEHTYALDLARLAVSDKYQGKGIGTLILQHIVDIAYRINDRFITTDALYEKWNWYKKRGFMYLIEDEIKSSTSSKYVYMIMDLYDPRIEEDYFDE